jgi:hypothetical protein
MVGVFSLLPQYLAQVPVYLVWLVGIVLAIVHWRRYPQPSLLTLIALVILFLRGLISTFLNTWLPLALHSQGWSVQGTSTFLLAHHIVSTLVAAVAYGLLLAAVFGWRRVSG